MRNRTPIRLMGLAGLALAACILQPAFAEVTASGTRLAVGDGQPRSYMSYGTLAAGELYAPIIGPLFRLGVTFNRQDDQVEVFVRNKPVAKWPVVTTREALSGNVKQPQVLVMGGNVFFPVRKLSEVAGLEVRTEGTDGTLRVAAKPAGAPTPRTPVATVPSPTPAVGQIAILTGVTLEQDGTSLRIAIKASGPVRARWIDLQHLKDPGPRLALDLANARWDDNVALPQGTGSVAQMRTGHPDGSTARLVLDMRGPKVTPGQVMVSTEGLSTALMPFGTRIARAATSDEIRKAIGGRIVGIVPRGSSRGGGLTGVLRQQGAGGLLVPPGGDFTQINPEEGADHNAWRYVVVHHSASPNGNLAAFDRAHRSKGWDGVAYHFVITNGVGGLDGGLEVSARWKSQKHGAHAGALPPPVAEDERNDYNEFGIGVCLVGNFEKAPPSAAQIKTLVELLQHLRSLHGIADDDIVGHGQVKGTACPGKCFPWTEIYQRLALTRPALGTPKGARRTHERCPWCLKAEQAKSLTTEVSRQK
jgi:hypothetical protein